MLKLPKLEEDFQKLQEMIRNKKPSLTLAQVADELGVSSRSAARYRLERMEEAGFVVHRNGRWYLKE